jgi:membrane protein implicated in regulation of membrane protease activity
MFGLSLTKILFTLAVVVIVWQGYKWLGRMQTRRDAIARETARGSGRGGRAAAAAAAPSSAEVEDMVECTVCGAFVPARGAVSCGRGECPYPG